MNNAFSQSFALTIFLVLIVAIVDWPISLILVIVAASAWIAFPVAVEIGRNVRKELNKREEEIEE